MSAVTGAVQAICVVASAASASGAVYTALSLVGDVQKVAAAVLAVLAVFFALSALCLKPSRLTHHTGTTAGGLRAARFPSPQFTSSEARTAG